MIIVIISAVVVVGFIAFCIAGSSNQDRDDHQEIDMSAVDEWLKRNQRGKNV